mgnify:CR=1 FL=1
MTLKIKSIVSYGRYYPSSVDAGVTYWLFSISDYKIYATEDMITIFHYTNCLEIEQSGMFIPLFKTDIEKLEEEYLLTLTNKEVQEYMRIKEKNKINNLETKLTGILCVFLRFKRNYIFFFYKRG